MKTKLFYTCPISTAYMAKNFGVKFKDFEEPHEYLVERDIGDYYGPWEVHPDSLHIFEPRPEDVIEVIQNRGISWRLCYHTISAKEELIEAENWKILQRNNIAFIMPEREV